MSFDYNSIVVKVLKIFKRGYVFATVKNFFFYFEEAIINNVVNTLFFKILILLRKDFFFYKFTIFCVENNININCHGKSAKKKNLSKDLR